LLPKTLQYYSAAVQASVLALPPTLLSQRMQHYGANLGEPHTKAFGGGLGADGIARVFYCTLSQRRIVMLHCFVKKSNKTPASDLQLAQARLREVKNAHA